MDDVQDEHYEEAVASLKRKRKFWADALLYAFVNGLLWLIWALTGHSTGNSIPWPAWVSMAWGFFLAIDAYKAFSRWPRCMISETEIEREMQLAPHWRESNSPERDAEDVSIERRASADQLRVPADDQTAPWRASYRYILTVRGRKTGRLYSTPVDVLELDGQRRLVAAYAPSSWVANARAAGEVTLSRSRPDLWVRRVATGAIKRPRNRARSRPASPSGGPATYRVPRVLSTAIKEPRQARTASPFLVWRCLSRRRVVR